MDNVLSGINAIAGVIGSAAFDSTDACVAHRMPAPYEPILVTHVMRELRSVLGILRYLDDSSPAWGMLVVGYDQGYVVLRPVDDRTTILVLASLSLNLSMLGIGFSVASLKLAEDRSSEPSAVGSNRGDDDTAPPTHAVGPDVMDALLKSLSKQIGPFARVILKEELTKMGASASTLVRSQYEDLVGMLARRLADPGERHEFMTDVAKLASRR